MEAALSVLLRLSLLNARKELIWWLGMHGFHKQAALGCHSALAAVP
jgi:hypothetical protein